MRDHYHLKSTVWPARLGPQLYEKVRTHLEGALNCHTKHEYETHVGLAYKSLEAFPSHIDYFQGYFNFPKTIAKYEIKKIRGSLGCISSAYSEQIHSSNEHACPTKITGVVTPEEQMRAMAARSDNWIRRDLCNNQELQFFRLSASQKLPVGSAQFEAMNCLTKYAYIELFMKQFDRCRKYTAEDFCDDNNILSGYVVYFNDGDRSFGIKILNGERCPNPSCVSKDIQCFHELVCDNRFILDKWSSRYWSDDKYRELYKDGHHLTGLDEELQ